jgi:hypothetical protein
MEKSALAATPGFLPDRRVGALTKERESATAYAVDFAHENTR